MECPREESFLSTGHHRPLSQVLRWESFLSTGHHRPLSQVLSWARFAGESHLMEPILDRLLPLQLLPLLLPQPLS